MSAHQLTQRSPSHPGDAPLGHRAPGSARGSLPIGRLGLVVLTAALALLCSADAGAESKAAEARRHYKAAQTYFAVGEFERAGEEYLTAYKLRPDAALLYNAAQSYRLGDQGDRALVLYRNYLEFFPKARNADEVRGYIEVIQEMQRDRAEEAARAPPKPRDDPSPSPSDEPSLVQTDRQDPSRDQPTPVYKKWWLWTIVGVVVVGGAVTAAVLLTRDRGPWANLPDVGPGSANGLKVQGQGLPPGGLVSLGSPGAGLRPRAQLGLTGQGLGLRF